MEANLQRQLDFIGVHDQGWRGLEIEVLGATNPTLPFWRNGRVFASSVDAAVQLIAEADRHHGADGVYARANAINPTWIAQWGTDIWMPSRTGQGTGNVDIVCRRYAFADFDPERGDHPSTIHGEMLHAVNQARRAVGACAKVLGTDKPFGLGMSGNGAHTAFKLGDLPNSDEVENLLWGLLNGLAHRFGDAKLKGDLSVCDARRLTPAFGTVKRKGEDTADRPHRRSFFVCHPAAVGLTLDQLRQLHAAFSVPGATRRGGTKRDRGQYVEDAGSVWFRCGQVNIRDVAGRLGIDTDNPRCPVCDGGDTLYSVQGGAALSSIGVCDCCYVGPILCRTRARAAHPGPLRKR